MKKITIIGLFVILGIVYANPLDVCFGVIDDGSQPQVPNIVSIPLNFNPEAKINEMKLARKSGDIEKTNKLSNEIYQWWLGNRKIEILPPTNGSNANPYPRNFKESSGPENPPSPLWGTDVRIAPQNGVNDVKIASLSNGHLYTIAVWDSSGNDHLLIHRSTNNGATWNVYHNYDFGSNYEIYYPNIKIIQDTIVISYVLHYNPANTERTWFIVCLPGSAFNSIYYGSPTGGFNPVDYYDLDFTTDSPVWPGSEYLYATWCTINQTGTDTTWVMFARSNELNVSNWEIPPTIIYNSAGSNIYFFNSKIAYGSASDRMWLISALHPYGYPSIYDETIWGWYSDDYGSSWNTTPVSITPYNNHRDEYECVIAGAHNNTNWVILYTQRDTTTGTNKDILITYSTDDGANWTTANWVVPYEEFLPNIWVDDQSHGFFATLRQNTSSAELTKYKFGAINDPTYWTGSITINDNTSDLSDVYGPSITRNMATGDAAIVWTAYFSGIYSIWYDAGGTGIAEGDLNPRPTTTLNISPNPSNGRVKISYGINKSGTIKISLYDATGRLIQNLTSETKSAGSYTLNLNNQELPNGIYFVRVESPEGTATKTMTIVR